MEGQIEQLSQFADRIADRRRSGRPVEAYGIPAWMWFASAFGLVAVVIVVGALVTS